MKDFNNDDIKDLSIDEINEMFQDVIEMPAPLIATVCNPIPKVHAVQNC